MIHKAGNILKAKDLIVGDVVEMKHCRKATNCFMDMIVFKKDEDGGIYAYRLHACIKNGEFLMQNEEMYFSSFSSMEFIWKSNQNYFI